MGLKEPKRKSIRNIFRTIKSDQNGIESETLAESQGIFLFDKIRPKWD